MTELWNSEDCARFFRCSRRHFMGTKLASQQELQQQELALRLFLQLRQVAEAGKSWEFEREMFRVGYFDWDKLRTGKDELSLFLRELAKLYAMSEGTSLLPSLKKTPYSAKSARKRASKD